MNNFNYTQSNIKFIPIMCESLAQDSITNFDLYYKQPNTKQYILYRGKNLNLSEKQFNYIKTKFKTLYVKTTEHKDYISYMEENIDEFLTNKNINNNAKAFILYDISQEVLSDIMENPNQPKVVERTKNLIKATSFRLNNDNNFFHNLLEVMSFDYSTYTHSINVSTFAINFAKSLNITEINLIESIGMGAFLHDIGKSKIDPEILFKKSRLSDSEMDIVKMHPIYGHEIVAKQFSDNEIIKNIVKYHHEKIDGSGYPEGLREGEIPIEVQIVTLSDIFDALTTNRCYKEKIKTFDALTIMCQEQNTGKHNGELLNKFVKMFSKYKK